MKNIIKLLNILVITGSVAGSTMACAKPKRISLGSNRENPNGGNLVKAKLNKIVCNDNNTLKFGFDITQTNHSLDDQIITAIDEFHNNPLTGYKIKYYDAQINGKEITDDKQRPGKIWFEIIASDSDLNWEGKTNRLEISSIKTDLNTLGALQDSNGNELSFLIKSTGYINLWYSYLNEDIIRAVDVFKDKFLKYYKIDYYDAQINGKKITDDKQKSGKVWVEISATIYDPTWEGKTKRFAVKIHKANLNTITVLLANSSYQSGILFVNFDAKKKYNNLDKEIASSYEFERLHLINYEMKYYDAQINGKEITNSYQEKDKKIWVEITAKDSDPTWEGKTNRLEISSFRYNNLEEITALQDANGNELSFVVDSTKSYFSLTDQIVKTHTFKDKPLTYYDIEYYDAQINGKNITFENQKPGKIWVQISIIYDEQNWYSKTDLLPITLSEAI